MDHKWLHERIPRRTFRNCRFRPRPIHEIGFTGLGWGLARAFLGSRVPQDPGPYGGAGDSRRRSARAPLGDPRSGPEPARRTASPAAGRAAGGARPREGTRGRGGPGRAVRRPPRSPPAGTPGLAHALRSRASAGQPPPPSCAPQRVHGHPSPSPAGKVSRARAQLPSAPRGAARGRRAPPAPPARAPQSPAPTRKAQS